MKTVKKFLCLAISLLILAMSIPLGVLAANTTEDNTQAAAGKVCRIGEGGDSVYYDNLNTAIGAVKTGETITVIKDISGLNTKLNTETHEGTVFTIDGNGFKFTNTTSANSMVLHSTKVTVKNWTFVGRTPFAVGVAATSASGGWTFDNCHITADDGYMMGMWNNTPDAYITLKNSTLIGNGKDTVFYFAANSQGTINISNTSITGARGQDTAYHPGNNSVFNFNSLKSFTVNLTGNSVVTSASSSISRASTIMNFNIAATVTLNADPTATLRMAGVGEDKVDNEFFIVNNGSSIGNLIVNGNPILSVSAHIARQGVMLPVFHGGKLTLSYTTNTGKTSEKHYFKDIDATSDVVFTPVYDTNAFVQDIKANDGYVCRIGTEYYKSLKEALQALKNSDSDNLTIVLIANIFRRGQETENNKTTADWNFNQLGITGKTFTIDGQNRYIFSNLTDYMDVDTNNITFQNIYMYLGRGVRQNASSASSATLKNCEIVLYSNIGFRPQKGDSTLNLEDCVIIGSPAEPLLLAGEAGASAVRTITINIKDSYLENKYGIGNAETGNQAVLNLSNYPNYDITLNITGNSSLVSDISHNNSTVSTVISADVTKTEINMDSTVKLVQHTSRINNSSFISGNASKITINGTPQIIASAEAIKRGIVLPNLGVTDKTHLGYSVDGKLYKAGNYKNTEAATSVNFAAAWISADSIITLTGASIRTAAPNGIRFETTVSKELIDLLGGNVTFGTQIAPKKFIDSRGGFDKLFTGDDEKIIRTKWADEGEDGSTYQAALVGIPNDKNAYTMEFAARGYFVVTYADGSNATFYSAFSETDNVRSLYQVAKAVYEAGTTDNAVINNIIAVVEGA